MSLQNYKNTATERFMRYVQVDTEADPNSDTQPSSEKQKDLSRILVDELLKLGISDAELDEHGYVYATIPATSKKEVPVICFCSHVDTSPDVSGKNVKPILHKNYDGKNITFPDNPELILSPEKHPYLLKRIGDDIITGSGNTLLGADDKAGVAIIMDFANHVISHPEIPHGKIRILFTPDEEIGRGVNAIDMKRLAANFGYTLDGGARGVLEGESFSADAVTITIDGISAHPGYAKNKLVSAIKVASAFMDSLPKDEWSPETTNKMEGFVHAVSMEATIEKATIQFIIRDFITSKLKDHENRLEKLLKAAVEQFPGAAYHFDIKEQYRNMKEMLDLNPQVMANAEEAYRRAGLEPKIESIRGGTDGSRLSFMGLPCPNIFTGEMAIHSRTEYVSVQDMESAVETMVHLVQVWEENAILTAK